MASPFDETQAIRTPTAVEQTDVSNGTRFARNRILDELPGVIFGIVTIIYIVTSLAKLA